MLENEKHLIRSAQSGDAQAFEKLYDHYIDAIYRFVVLKVSSQRDAEDLTHDVFLSSWRNIGTYKFQGLPFSSWLYRIARNRVIDHYRTRRVHTGIQYVDPNLFQSLEDHEKSVDQSIDLDRIGSSLSTLSNDQKDVMIMRFVEELSHREIAKALGKSEGAIRLIQHRALRNLRELLKKDEEKEA